MDNSAYETPKADLDNTSQVDVPEKIAKHIRNGWIAAIISGAMTLGIVLLVVATEEEVGLVDVWTLIDVALIFLLAFGIYKKSRFAATAMLVYFVFSKISMMIETGKPGGLGIGIIFIYFYYQAMVATYQYHKLLKSPAP